MSESLIALGLYLREGPLLWLTITLLAYQAGLWLFRRTGLPLFNPVLVAITIMVALLALTNTPYETFFQGARLIHFLLGPATVALAIPLCRHLGTLRRMLVPLLGALLVGSAAAILSAVGIGWLFGLAPRTLLSLAPKSVTTPIAMGISEQVGGLPSLTAVLVIITGILGAVAAPAVLRLARIREDSVRGFAMGLASHGIGTSRALELSQEAGAFSGLAMGLNGLLTAILAPLLLRWLGLL